MQLKPEEISKVIRSQIKYYENAIQQNETGTILMVGDGIAEAVVTSAVALSEDQMAALKAKLEKISGKKISLIQKTDASVLAGLRVELEGKLLDGTVQSRMSGISRKLNEIIV